MGWYAVHVIMRVQFKDSVASDIPVWENVFLIQADTGNDAAARARELAKDNEGDSQGSFTWDSRSAKWVFAGIRKVTICDAPASGVEVAWSQFRLRNADDLKALIDGKEVVVTYDEEPEPRGR